MKHLLFNIMLLLFICSPATLNAQNNTLDISLSSSSLNIDSKQVNSSSTIIKTGNTLHWNQSNNGNSNSEGFTITNTVEDWNQELSIGSITYTITIDEYQGSLELIGNEENGITATLTIHISDTQSESYIFNIDSITYQ